MKFAPIAKVTLLLCGFAINDVRGQSYAHLRGFGPPQASLTAVLGPNTRPMAADVNRDGLDDIVLFNLFGSDVDVCLNVTTEGSQEVRFLAPALWKFSFCPTTDVPLVGDWNQDGFVDIGCVGPPDSGTGWRPLTVAMSDGLAFGNTIEYFTQMALQNDLIRTGDVNGDGGTDVMVFDRVNRLVSGIVSTLGGTHGFNRYRATGFCGPGQIPALTDMDGDGKDDLISFVIGNGQVRRALSGWPAREYFVSAANEPDALTNMNGGDLAMGLFSTSPFVAAADFTGDGYGDVLEFSKGFRQVNVAWSDRQIFTGEGFGGKEWHADFAADEDPALVGKFDWDRNVDIAMLPRSAGAGSSFTGIRVAVAGGHALPVAPQFPLGVGGLRRDRLNQPIPARGDQRLLIVRTVYAYLAPNASLPNSVDLARRFFGVNPNPPTETVASYFHHISHGHLRIVPAPGNGLLDGVITVQVPVGDPVNTWTYLIAKVQDQLVASGNSLMNYDTDGDGWVENHELTIVEMNGGEGGQVQGLFQFSPNGYPNVKLAITPFLLAGNTMPADGVIYTACHELAHTFGAPDLYHPNGGAMAVQTLLGGNTTPNIAHLDIFHRMRAGWVTPRSFNLSQPYCAAPIVSLTNTTTPDVEVPLHFFETAPAGTTLAQSYFFEMRSPFNRFETAMASANLGPGGVFWHATTNAADGALQIEKVIHPGNDGTLQSLVNLAGDDFIQNFPGIAPAYVSGGVDLELQTPIHANDVLFHVSALFPTNKPWLWPDRGGYNPNGMGWKLWYPSDGEITLRWKNQTALASTFRLGTSGDKLSLQWGTGFRPWLSRLRPPTSGTAHCVEDLITIDGFFGVDIWSPRLIPRNGTEYFANILSHTPEQVIVRLPSFLPSGEFPLYMKTPAASGAVSNSLTVKVSNQMLDWMLTRLPDEPLTERLFEPSADFDGDGVPNQIEFLLNTHPGNAASGTGALTVDLSAAGTVKLRWTQHTYNASKHKLVCEYSTNLREWSRLPGVSTDAEFLIYRNFTATLGSRPGKLFARLTAERY